MNKTNTIHDLQKEVQEFVDERDWNQFHNPKNLSMNIAVEASELMELFLWCESQNSRASVEEMRKEVEDECADVLIALLAFANASHIDLAAAFSDKLARTKAKYPVEKAKGKATKYDKL